LLTTLRSAGDSEASIDIAVDLILHEVVLQALPATGATGAAIALSRDGEMVCRATTGENAPELGVKLNVNSGLSVECVRTGQIQRCDDSEFDPRVDAQLCRQLGIRSFVVTPLISQGKVVGIFEIFSPHSWAFDDRAVAALEGLGQWAVSAVEEAARTREKAYVPEMVLPDENNRVQDYPAAEPHKPLTSQSPEPELARERKPAPLADHFEEVVPVVRPRRDLVTTMLGVAIVIVALLLGWVLGMSSWQRAWMKYQQGALPAKTVLPAAKPVPAEPKTEKATVPAQTSAIQNAAPEPRTDALVHRPASQPPEGLVVYESGKVVFRETPRKLPIPAADRQRIPSSGEPTVPQTKTEAAVGSVGFAGGTNPSMTGTAPAAGTEAPTAPPGAGPVSQPASRVSQISGGHLLQRVPPVYPSRAKELHLQGKVMLEALVGRDGKVREIKVLSGDAILAQAAMTAVRQWEYEPFLLNGIPVDMPTRITVNFTYP
jgi:TonB family protein